MKLIEANIVLFVCFVVCLPSPCRTDFVKDFSSSVTIYESILMGFNSRKKNEYLILILNSKNIVDLWCPESCD